MNIPKRGKLYRDQSYAKIGDRIKVYPLLTAQPYHAIVQKV